MAASVTTSQQRPSRGVPLAWARRREREGLALSVLVELPLAPCAAFAVCLRPISRENGSEGVQEGAWAKTSKGDALQRGRRSCSRSGARRSPGNSARPARLATTAQCKPQAHLGRATGEKRSPTVLRGGLRKADATAAERTRRQGGCVRPGVVRVERCRAQQES